MSKQNKPDEFDDQDFEFDLGEENDWEMDEVAIDDIYTNQDKNNKKIVRTNNKLSQFREQMQRELISKGIKTKANNNIITENINDIKKKKLYEEAQEKKIQQEIRIQKEKEEAEFKKQIELINKYEKESNILLLKKNIEELEKEIDKLKRETGSIKIKSVLDESIRTIAKHKFTLHKLKEEYSKLNV